MGLLFNQSEALANPSRDYWENEGRFREGNPMRPRMVRGIPFNDDFMDTDAEASGNLDVLRKQWEQRKLNEFTNMTPYSQNAMRGNPYGNSDSYYDPQSGVASIGYGAPKQRRLIAIRNGKEIYEGDIDAPFEDASIANEAAAKRASAFNAQGNQEYMAQQNELRAQPDAMGYEALKQRYNPQKAPSYSRFGNEFSLNGQTVTNDIEGTAKAAGLGVDDYIQSQYSAAKKAAADNALKRISGDAMIGTSQAKDLMNDPQWLAMDDAGKMSAYKGVMGRDLSQDLLADKYGGNMTANQLAAKMGAGKRREGAIQRLKGLESIYGENAASLIQYYDPKTQTAMIPGKDRFDKDTNEWVQSPARSIQIPFAQYQEALNDRALMSGFEDAGQMSENDPQAEYARMLQRRPQELAAMKQQQTANIEGLQEFANPAAAFARQVAPIMQRETRRPMLEANQNERKSAARQAAIARMIEERKALREMEQYQQDQANPYQYGTPSFNF